ncbi:MAG TPA: hypothetical protein VIY48_04625 [Candidatus Paceibacterota bacterium]
MTAHKPWTPEEDAELTRLSKTLLQKEIAHIMGRPKGSVASRMARLGLSREKDNANNRIGTIVRPRPGVLIHYGHFNEKRGAK